MEKLVITTYDVENNKRIFELFFNGLENAKEMVEKIMQMLNSNVKWILLGPDDINNYHIFDAVLLKNLTITITHMQMREVILKKIEEAEKSIPYIQLPYIQLPYVQPPREIAISAYAVPHPHDCENTWVRTEIGDYSGEHEK